MRLLRLIGVILAVATLSACGSSKFKTYNGPEVTRVVVDKGDRRMRLYHHNRVLKTYPIQLGFAPSGDKKIEGDGRTPEGFYTIDKRNPDSRFHLSLGIDYPNAYDIYEAQMLGKSPGGDIFIHGGPPKGSRTNPKSDWTWGCIAVSDKQMEWIYAMIQDGTPIQINP